MIVYFFWDSLSILSHPNYMIGTLQWPVDPLVVTGQKSGCQEIITHPSILVQHHSQVTRLNVNIQLYVHF